MTPFYTDDSVTLYHGDCREVLDSMAEESVAAVITDPPYTDRTHSKARTPETAGIVFDSISDQELRLALVQSGRISRGWVVATLDYRHAVAFDIDPPFGLKVNGSGCGSRRTRRRNYLATDPRRDGRLSHTCIVTTEKASGTAAAPTVTMSPRFHAPKVTQRPSRCRWLHSGFGGSQT